MSDAEAAVLIEKRVSAEGDFRCRVADAHRFTVFKPMSDEVQQTHLNSTWDGSSRCAVASHENQPRPRASKETEGLNPQSMPGKVLSRPRARHNSMLRGSVERLVSHHPNI